MPNPSDITSVVWSAVNLPDGLVLGESTGIISGTPTTPGSYTTNVTVTTNWGTDTKAISIIVAIPDSWKPDITPGQVLYLTAGEEMEPYQITGTNISMSLSPILAANDWHLIHEYVKANGVDDFTVGTEIMTTYTEPLGPNANTEYDIPMILVDKSTAITQNGVEVPALYFMSKFALPCTGIYGDNNAGTNNYGAGIMFDNKEPSSSNAGRKNNGNNRYMHSALRQWLNGTDTSWWTSQHPTDAAPDYTNRKGLLSCLSPDLVAELQPIKVQVDTATVDGGEVDVMYDKIFIPSLEEINRVGANSSASPRAGVEGHAWQYWKDKLDSETRVGEGAITESVIKSPEVNPGVYTNYPNSPYARYNVCVHLRSAYRISDYSHWRITDYGNIGPTEAAGHAKGAPNRATPCFAIIGA